MSIKEQALRLVEAMPDDVTWTQALERIQIAAALTEAEAEIDAGDFATQDKAEERLRYLAAIAEGRTQLDRGEGVPHDEAKRQIQSWFQK